MLTSADHSTLLNITTQPTVTPDEASLIKKLIPQNSWRGNTKISWWYPVGDDGYPIEGKAKCYDHPIRKAREIAASRPVDPASLAQTQPWVAMKVCRTTYFTRLARQRYFAAPLNTLPSWVDREQGLKLHLLLSDIASAGGGDINELWARVCKAMER